MSKALNSTKHWSQDRDFQLKLTLRDRDVVFTVKDRTGTEYSFNERSGGLKYFLSDLVQYLRHDFATSDQQVLLMDEPDAFLSSTGQRDVLRIFEGFAFAEDPEHHGCQVIYVTHSPFLIDKNHGERIRVLEKGRGDEGTRVVHNVAQNHYEPLRSAFGAFVAETTFIGNCNLFVEGTSDQVLLAGISSWLRRSDASQLENIDLNTITLVPAGGVAISPTSPTSPEAATSTARPCWCSSTATLPATRRVRHWPRAEPEASRSLIRTTFFSSAIWIALTCRSTRPTA